MNERPWKSQCGKYTGTIVGYGKTATVTLDKKSQERLAGINVISVRKQNKALLA